VTGQVDRQPFTDFRRAQRHLRRRDPILKELITRIGPCTLRHDPDGFGLLARAIISQQISTKAARAITARLVERLGDAGLCPAAVVRAHGRTLRAAGLSASKAAFIRDLARRCHKGELELARLPSLSDEEVIERLTIVHGIGRWTAEMHLIFSLGRPDVLPVADFGLRVAMRKHYGLPDPPHRDHLVAQALPWKPYRSIATWFMWRSLGNVPQSD
jgi:DNA-3-methyladenine glycosylase II